MNGYSSSFQSLDSKIRIFFGVPMSSSASLRGTINSSRTLQHLMGHVTFGIPLRLVNNATQS